MVSPSDEVTPFSRFAVSRHNFKRLPHKFVALKGYGHRSIIDNTEYLSTTDSVPIAPNKAFRDEFVKIVASYLDLDSREYLVDALHATADLADPIVKALQLEGSAALGEPQCNSDFPTNPSCQYPIYPGHSLPPGPEPAPNPPLSENCVCGSPWVMTVGSTLSADLEASPRPSTTLITNDAFHNVSDTHPFHLPNIFNECSSDLSESCALNITTVSMAILKAGDLFPSDESVLSAFELRTKFKSRQATWERAGFGSGTDELDQGTNVCRDINQQAYDWALANAEPSVRELFEKYGEPYVMVDDVEAPIGDHGPTWIDEELIYTRVVDETTGKSHIEVQSWSFVVANVKDGDVPWFIAVGEIRQCTMITPSCPMIIAILQIVVCGVVSTYIELFLLILRFLLYCVQGMHYCKLLSPARAMEWIYSNGVARALPTAP
jgi:hypothetical protein